MYALFEKIVSLCETFLSFIYKHQKLCFALLVLLIILSYLESLVLGGLNQDVVYYMNTVKLMTEGYIPYSDFKLGYTPLAFYLLYIPVSLFGTLLPTALSCSYIALLIDAFLVYKICNRYAHSNSIALFASLSFLMMTRIHNSDYFYLEPFVLLPGLSSIMLLFSQKKRCMFLSGVLCFMAFWTKQYGLGFIFLATAYVLIDSWFSKKSCVNVTTLWAGFIVGAFLFVGLMIMQGIELHQMFNLSGTNYSREGGIYGLWLGSKTILRWCCPLLVVILYSVRNMPEVIKSPFWVMSILGISGFVLQTYIRAYPHYLILMSPFCIFALVYGLKNIKHVNSSLLLKTMCFIMTLLFVQRFAEIDLELYHDRNARKTMIEIAHNIEKHIPRGSHNVYAYSANDKLLAYHLETLPPVDNRKCLGLSFEGSHKELLESLQSSDYIIFNGTKKHDVISILNKSFTKKRMGKYDIYVKKQE